MEAWLEVSTHPLCVQSSRLHEPFSKSTCRSRARPLYYYTTVLLLLPHFHHNCLRRRGWRGGFDSPIVLAVLKTPRAFLELDEPAAREAVVVCRRARRAERG